jgi:hypothetical protein
MIPCYANLITIDVDEMLLATQVSLREVQSTLGYLEKLALDDSIRDVWDGATFRGAGFRVGAGRAIGETLDVAPVAGLGFWTQAWPTHLSASAAERVEEERRATERVVEAARGRLGLPIAARTGVISETDYSFEVAFRRRIAYAMGYRASLLAQGWERYDAIFRHVVDGEAEQIETDDGCDETISQFSLTLNLLARLEGAVAYERDHGRPHPHAPGRVRDYEAKVDMLESRLNELADLVRGTLNEDGRIALHAILYELRSQRMAGVWNVEDSPRWGGVANSDVFQNQPV